MFEYGELYEKLKPKNVTEADKYL